MPLIHALFHLRPEGWAVLIVLMLPLFGVLLVTVLRVGGTVGQERARLAGLRHKVDAVLAEEERPEAEDTVEELQGMLQGAPAQSPVKRIFQAVQNARLLASPDVQATTAAVLAGQEGRLAPVRNVPNLLMLAGLLGTVLGLAASIAELAPQIAAAARATEPTQLAEALGNTLQIMQGAFGCSLWGILLSLIASVLLAQAGRASEAFTDELSAFTHAQLVPALFPRALEGQIERMVRFLKGSSDTFREIQTNLAGVAENLNTVLTNTGTSLETSMTRLQTTSEQVAEVFAGINQTVDTLSESLRDGASNLAAAQDTAAKTLSLTHEQLGDQLRKQSEQVLQLQDRVNNNATKVMEEAYAINQALGRTMHAFGEAGRLYENAQTRTLDRLDSGFQSVQHLLGEHVKDNQTALTSALTAMGVNVLAESRA